MESLSGLALVTAFRLLATFENVGTNEEVGEEDEQSDNVIQIGLCDTRRVGLATRCHKVNGLGIHQYKLHHLTHGQGRLPPHILGVESNEVVSVHNCVNESIEHDGQIYITVISNIRVQPVKLKIYRR